MSDSKAHLLTRMRREVRELTFGGAQSNVSDEGDDADHSLTTLLLRAKMAKRSAEDRMEMLEGMAGEAEGQRRALKKKVSDLEAALAEARAGEAAAAADGEAKEAVLHRLRGEIVEIAFFPEETDTGELSLTSLLLAAKMEKRRVESDLEAARQQTPVAPAASASDGPALLLGGAGVDEAAAALRRLAEMLESDGTPSGEIHVDRAAMPLFADRSDGDGIVATAVAAVASAAADALEESRRDTRAALAREKSAQAHLEKAKTIVSAHYALLSQLSEASGVESFEDDGQGALMAIGEEIMRLREEVGDARSDAFSHATRAAELEAQGHALAPGAGADAGMAEALQQAREDCEEFRHRYEQSVAEVSRLQDQLSLDVNSRIDELLSQLRESRDESRSWEERYFSLASSSFSRDTSVESGGSRSGGGSGGGSGGPDFWSPRSNISPGGSPYMHFNQSLGSSSGGGGGRVRLNTSNVTNISVGTGDAWVIAWVGVISFWRALSDDRRSDSEASDLDDVMSKLVELRRRLTEERETLVSLSSKYSPRASSSSPPRKRPGAGR